MTDRTDHCLAAQGNLSDARHFATEAGIRPPREEEALSLQWAQVHALLAIGDALRDRLDPGLLRGLERMNDVLSQLGARGPITGDTETDSEPDPLDENDHRDRIAVCDRVTFRAKLFAFTRGRGNMTARGCECHWWPSWIAAKLIKQAVKEAVQ